MWQVTLKCGNVKHTFKYPTETAAEDYAKAHRSTGYYEVSVTRV